MVLATINGVDVNVNSGAIIADDPPTRYLLVTLDSRMSNGQYQSLLKEGLSMNHHAGNNVYVCTRTSKQSLSTVKGLSFVRGLALYPTSVIIESKLQRLKSDPAKASEVVNLNVRLHDESQKSAKDIFTHISGASKSAALLAVHDTDDKTVQISLPLGQLDLLSAIDDIAVVEQLLPAKPRTVQARAKIGVTDSIVTTNNWTGANEWVGICDDGFTKNPGNLGFANRTITMDPNFNQNATGTSNDYTGHGTHVTGCAAANLTSSDPKSLGGAVGTSTGCKLFLQTVNFDRPPTTTAILASHPGTDKCWIRNMSWGPPNANTDGAQEGYTTDAKNVDDSMYSSPELLVILAAGNDARTRTATQAQIGGRDASKNSLVVGSCSNNRPWDPSSGALTDTQYSTAQGSVQYPNYIPTYSNRGPSKLGHLKPDLVAPGLPVLSIRSSNYSDSGVYGTVDDTRLAFMTGTSMSAPLVAGCAALLREAVKKTKSTATVSGALLKALLVNGTIDLAGGSTRVTCAKAGDKTKEELVTFPMTPAPNVCQGYGMLSVARSLAAVVKSNSTTQGCLDYVGLKTDGLLVIPVVVPAGKYQINVTLAYNDPGSASLENVVNLTLKFAESSLGTAVPLVPTKMGFEDRRETQPAAYSRNTVQKITWQQPANRTTETKANINVSVSKLYAKQESIDFGIAYSTVKLD